MRSAPARTRRAPARTQRRTLLPEGPPGSHADEKQATNIPAETRRERALPAQKRNRRKSLRRSPSPNTFRTVLTQETRSPAQSRRPVPKKPAAPKRQTPTFSGLRRKKTPAQTWGKGCCRFTPSLFPSSGRKKGAEASLRLPTRVLHACSMLISVAAASPGTLFDVRRRFQLGRAQQRTEEHSRRFAAPFGIPRGRMRQKQHGRHQRQGQHRKRLHEHGKRHEQDAQRQRSAPCGGKPPPRPTHAFAPRHGRCHSALRCAARC